MPALSSPYVDGWYGPERELTVTPQAAFPFSKSPTPDTYSRRYDRIYEVFPKVFVPRIGVRTAWTNLVLKSEQFDDAAWTKTNLSATADAIIAPDGNVTMDKLLETVTNAQHSASQAVTVAAVANELSVFAKNGLNRSWIKLSFTDSAAVVFSAFFNIDSGYVGTVSAGVTALVTPLGNGDYYCVIRFTPAAGAGTYKVNVSTDGATVSYAGDVTKGVYLWGAQIAAGAAAPYISTTTTTRTILAPDRDRADPMAYLIIETDPTNETSETARVVRTFSRVPLTQTTPGSLFITKPDIPGAFPQVFGSLLVTRPISTVASYDAYSIQTIIGDSGAPGGQPTGGTFTLTFGANTTSALAYNATAAAVQTALNALASITTYGGVTVSGSNTSGYTIAFNYATISATVGSLTGATASAVVTPQSNGLIQNVVISASWGSPGISGASSFTPSGANPITTQFGGGIYGTSRPSSLSNIGFFQGNIFSNQPATGGTYTITVFGQTTAAINWNDSAATVQAALNALSNVAANGGYTVVATPTGFSSSGPNVTGFNAYLPDATFTGGTYTLTVLGQTTGTIAYNASLATIQTAINALSNVTARGGVIVSGAGFTGSSISITITFANVASLTGSAASLTPSGVSVTITPSNSQGYSQLVTFGSSTSNTRLLTVNNHGFVAGDTLFFKDNNGAYYAGLTDGITFPTANTIQLVAAVGTPYSLGVSLIQVGKRTLVGYSPTATQTRVKYVTTFYLPGVTPGIATLDDIPLPLFQGDPSSLLTAIFAGTTSINFQVGDLTQWMDSPIIKRPITTINASKI